ncbi:hypothetical protein PG999_014138 [Apiospora kogelbergensis]|uniref:DUF7587 domain-containing protein n=1 Tax=Apiospora kogelbergensis TaxID=1337665 RepID=A0AAW0Q816_9PEZI
MHNSIEKLQILIDSSAIGNDVIKELQEPELETGSDSAQANIQTAKATLVSQWEATTTKTNEVQESAILSNLESAWLEELTMPLDRSSFGFMFWISEEMIEAKIKDIVAITNDAQVALWMVAEECYKEASTPNGCLYLNDYYVLYLEIHGINDPRQRLPFCRSFWVNLWARVVNELPGGPTLFCPPLKLGSGPMEPNRWDIPPYLFRTFDPNSSGTNDARVVASMMSGSWSQQESRIDILAREPQQAAIRLHKHLTKSLFGADRDDNLVSWTSSLLFAIQYALWREHYSDPFDVKICAVDTTKFPPGQFVQDVWLLEKYRGTATQIGLDYTDLLRWRNALHCYNGEYLSQGALHHGTRSCLVTLGQLQDAGLFDLYHELSSPAGRRQWTKRVKDLRMCWALEHVTSSMEIHSALLLGRCFSLSEPLNMALMFLSFKERRFNLVVDLDNPPEWAVKPVEHSGKLIPVNGWAFSEPYERSIVIALVCRSDCEKYGSSEDNVV